jgi:uncharacterized protein with HEPN domain
MDKQKDDRYYAKRILRYVSSALNSAEHVDFSRPEANEEGIFAINFCMIQIRELAEKLSSTFLKSEFPVSLTDLA